MCKILWRKKLDAKFLVARKTRAKINRQKYLTILVRVHNDERLALCGREGTGEWTFIFQPNERSHKRASTLYYRLPYNLKLSSWSSSCIPCRYLPARIIPTFHHNGHELNCQIFLTIYFCTRFSCDKKFCIKLFCDTKFCTFISAYVVSLLSKINVQIFVTQTIVMQQILM